MGNDIGNILRAKRTELGLSISDISKKIRIRDTFLIAIEKNDISSLPESYYDLFVKKYADFLHAELPEDEEKKKKNDMILELLSERNGGRKKDNRFKSAVRRILLFTYIHRKFFIGFLISLMFFLFIRHIYVILNEDEKSDKNESMVRIITIEGGPDDKMSVAIRDSFMIGDDNAELFYLKITAVDSCYIYYFTDSLSISEMLLAPGKYLDLKAENIIEAKLGQGAAVDIEFNDNKVMEELKQLKGLSAVIRATRYGVQKIKRSEKIGTYLQKTYDLDE